MHFSVLHITLLLLLVAFFFMFYLCSIITTRLYGWEWALEDYGAMCICMLCIHHTNNKRKITQPVRGLKMQLKGIDCEIIIIIDNSWRRNFWRRFARLHFSIQIYCVYVCVAAICLSIYPWQYSLIFVLLDLNFATHTHAHFKMDWSHGDYI